MTGCSQRTVVIADDHEGMLTRICEVLRGLCRVVATAKDGLTAIAAVIQFKPDIAILDISMPNLDGLNAAAEIRRLGLPAKLIFLTIQEDEEFIQAARDMSASYVLKCQMHTDLAIAIRESLAGRTFTSQVSSLPLS
jgi:DNA-binding NarL/FixJ family response regulator